ncbi:MAG TPA: FMN-binding protein [Gaiellaceae bacterium]|nr:FMN-binding protein [Gaiellaceae bacterium]
MKRAVTAALTALVLAAPVANAWAGANASPPKKKKKKKVVVVAPRTIQGPAVDMRWGPVQVTIVVKGKVLTDVQATAPTERSRSAFINNQAIPILRQEALQAKSANIDLLSGATMTSEAFAQSLQAALTQAGL